MANYQNILVVIPSLDPDERLLNVIRGVQAKGFTDILLVDDGSAPENQHYFEEGAALGCTVLHHEVNKGKGRALKTAFEWFMKKRPDSAGAVTIDGDDQHKPDDIAACVDLLDQQKRNVLILGARTFDLRQQADLIGVPAVLRSEGQRYADGSAGVSAGNYPENAGGFRRAL